MNNFFSKAIKDIRLWAWTAAILPMATLAGFLFIWIFAPISWLQWAITWAVISMFTVAIFWWWWIMWTVFNLVKQWSNTTQQVVEVSNEVKEIRSAIVQMLTKDK